MVSRWVCVCAVGALFIFPRFAFHLTQSGSTQHWRESARNGQRYDLVPFSCTRHAGDRVHVHNDTHAHQQDTLYVRCLCTHARARLVEHVSSTFTFVFIYFVHGARPFDTDAVHVCVASAIRHTHAHKPTMARSCVRATNIRRRRRRHRHQYIFMCLFRSLAYALAAFQKSALNRIQFTRQRCWPHARCVGINAEFWLDHVRSHSLTHVQLWWHDKAMSQGTLAFRFSKRKKNPQQIEWMM